MAVLPSPSLTNTHKCRCHTSLGEPGPVLTHRTASPESRKPCPLSFSQRCGRVHVLCQPFKPASSSPLAPSRTKRAKGGAEHDSDLVVGGVICVGAKVQRKEKGMTNPWTPHKVHLGFCLGTEVIRSNSLSGVPQSLLLPLANASLAVAGGGSLVACIPSTQVWLDRAPSDLTSTKPVDPLRLHLLP